MGFLYLFTGQSTQGVEAEYSYNKYIKKYIAVYCSVVMGCDGGVLLSGLLSF